MVKHRNSVKIEEPRGEARKMYIKRRPFFRKSIDAIGISFFLLFPKN